MQDITMNRQISGAETAPREEPTLEYKSAGLSVNDRVADLLGRMTLDEKVAQMLCIWGRKNSMLFD